MSSERQPVSGAADVADAIAAAALAVPGVTRLHPGSFGEVATYLPGRRVAGVRSTESTTEVHVVVRTESAIIDVAEAVRAAVAPLVATPVDVYVEDLEHSVNIAQTPQERT